MASPIKKAADNAIEAIKTMSERITSFEERNTRQAQKIEMLISENEQLRKACDSSILDKAVCNSQGAESESLLKPCPICGSDDIKHPRKRTQCADCGFNCKATHWNALPRRGDENYTI